MPAGSVRRVIFLRKKEKRKRMQVRLQPTAAPAVGEEGSSLYLLPQLRQSLKRTLRQSLNRTLRPSSPTAEALHYLLLSRQLWDKRALRFY